METQELKRKIMHLIGSVIDEESLQGVDSFVEMKNYVVHYSGEGGEKYFKLSLEETSEEDYFVPYEP